MPWKLHRFVILVAFGLAAVLLPLSTQAQTYKPLMPLLVDIPQWEAEAPEGMTMASDGQEIVWAARNYRKGDAEISVILGVGHPMASQAEAMGQGGKMQYQAGGVVYETATVKGFPVVRFYSKDEKTGFLLVALNSGALPASLIVQFSELDSAEGFAIAERFDWSKMQKAVARK
ncbi:hypothetical protein [Desertibaculum subflavum]|uniref:hypothetical protein n=1 Tax=Desertibaculum subflavum TaxID=2268458 RepID=UPI000E66AA85